MLRCDQSPFPRTSGSGIRHDGRADTCSLLLTQPRYEHGKRSHDTSPVVSGSRVGPGEGAAAMARSPAAPFTA
jgi:hypothetical protein